MNINEKIKGKLLEKNNIITTSQVLELGFSKQLLTNYVREGLLVRVRQGIYILPDSIDDDLYTLMLRSKHVVFSHETAAFLVGLSERTPFIHFVSIPSGSSLPHSIRSECKCFYVKPELYNIGIIEVKTTFGNIVRVYNAERIICDILRSRARLDDEMVISIIKNYAKSEQKDLNKLAVYAKLFKVEDDVKRYLEVLI